MGDPRYYKKRDYILADRVSDDGEIVTRHGKRSVKAGDYVVYSEGGTDVMSGPEFEREWIHVDEEERTARDFTPAGQTVENVIAFMNEHPEEIERVKELERTVGSSRKGILDY